MITVRAAAKINLHLGVGPVRADGFHPLATAYQAISLFSTVTATPAEDWSVTCTGGLGIDVLGLDPTFPIKYMVYFLLVVAVGGAGTIKGPLLAAIVLGIFDVAGKYYVPEVGAFVIYALMVILLLLFPHGLLGRRT